MSIKSVSEFSGAASSMSYIVTSANGLVVREADTAYLSLSGRGRGVEWEGEGGGVGVGAYWRLGGY